ncbi:MAG: MMPL family transporter [Actinomycetota bacterium]|nr:MMPL family transporter [Actinomycetota bacterium]
MARLLVRLRWWIIVFWLAAVLGSLFLLPSLSDSRGSSDLQGLIPEDAPAVVNELRSVELFGFPLMGRTAVVQRDPDGLSVYDQGRAGVAAAAVTRERYSDLGRLRGALPISNGLGVFPSSNEQGTTTVTYLLFGPEVSFGAQSNVADRYIERFFNPRDSVVGVTGSVPARAAQGRLISDALPTAELLTLTAIMLIVGIALRSVVAPLVAVLTTAVAYVMTLRLSGALTELVGISAPSELEPVVVALLLGVVTDYVVFYLSALRTELEKGTDRLEAARAATTRFGPIVTVAGIAVALGTGALVVADSLFFRALGPALVFTVLVGLLVAVTLVPALMAVLGRWVFWPTNPQRRRPRDDAAHHPPMLPALVQALTSSRRRATAVVIGCVAGLSLAALPLLGLNLGVSFVGSLPADSGVRQAAYAARTGFAAGILSPTTVLLEGQDLDQQRQELATLGRLLEAEPGVAGTLGPGDLPRRLEAGVLVTRDGQAARFLMVLDDPALGASAIDSVTSLQDRLDQILARSGIDGGTIGLAGDTPAAAFIVDQTTDDLLRIALAALGANLLMLVIFLRAVVAAIYLLIGSMLSLGAALGLTMLVFGQLDPGAGLTFYVPFAAAVLLLAFGSDYNIFAVGTIWDEARRRPLRDAIVTAMPPTITAIFIAGLALAASFGLLAVVPLVPFRQLAFVMFVGIALDVLVVRSLLLPALLTVFGTASAWPSSRLTAHPGPRSQTRARRRPSRPDPAERTADPG